jgi:hypothetical protein
LTGRRRRRDWSLLLSRPGIDPGTDPRPGPVSAEAARIAEMVAGTTRWDRWGPYLAERQWGTVREDYSANGDAWGSFTHDQARSRAYRWGEDGLLGISDDSGRLCFAIALWNGSDPILKERLFGLTGPEGNHGEDVKEVYHYLDATPSHAYLKARYRYPQEAFPYGRLVAENARRGRDDPEFELADTGIFDDGRWFDVVVEYAKAAADDIVIRISATNRGPAAAALHLLPTLWYRNTWSWGREPSRPTLHEGEPVEGGVAVRAMDRKLGEYHLSAAGSPTLLFTDNDSDTERLWGRPNASPYVKDGIGAFVVTGDHGAVNPARTGTKVSAYYSPTIAAGATETIVLRLTQGRPGVVSAAAEAIVESRIREADEFYAGLAAGTLSPDEAIVQRQAFAGLIWSKQVYHYDVAQWLDGDPSGPPPPPERLTGRNSGWRELDNHDVLSMPDSWEYPWYAAWDLAFHCLPFAIIDPAFAKAQLIHLTREWYMHPNGQLPAYEWSFSDVNPPVHAWAAWRVYKIDRRVSGVADRAFLERIFHKLLLNFTWWVNRKDSDGHNIFEGGFLGLDNIGVFDRSAPLPVPGHLGQADGTAWMGMYSLHMLVIALELAIDNPVYEDIATKFFEHFLYIAGAINGVGVDSMPLWDDADGFFYDTLHLDSGESIPLRVRSLVGLIPLLAVETLEPDVLERMPGFRSRLRWFLGNRPELASLVASWEEPGLGERRLLALVHGHRMKRLLSRMLDEAEFLSAHGVRSVSRAHLAHPYVLDLGGVRSTIGYEPSESRSGIFGGNSNWRGPVWFPINYLLIEALEKFDHYYGPDFMVDHPTGSGQTRTLGEVADDLGTRLCSIFLRDASGRRPVFGDVSEPTGAVPGDDDPLFFEYFDGETGAGLGASHQTGWTALVAKLLDSAARQRLAAAERDPPADRETDGPPG